MAQLSPPVAVSAAVLTKATVSANLFHTILIRNSWDLLNTEKNNAGRQGDRS
uniref:Uncharacterized protein n=1 Tax=Desulfovibrio desulfuricans (strain ATCC 27774 / DSM 6949 / MB) TaxID=525146 RepID=B8J0U2_DESDA